MINYDLTIICEALGSIVNVFEDIMQEKNEQYRSCFFKQAIRSNVESIKGQEHPLGEQLLALLNRNYPRYISTVEMQKLVEKHLEAAREALSEAEKFRYKKLYVDNQSYKVKTVLYSGDRGSRVIQYVIATFYSRQEANAFLANMQKGLKGQYLSGEYGNNLATVKNGYLALIARAEDENAGDGTHAIIYHNDEHVIRVHPEESRVDRVFSWLRSNTRTGLMPEWKEYFYNCLSNRGLIEECEGFDLTGMAPTVLVLSEDIDTSLMRLLKQEGLRKGEIKLPVSENVPLDPSMTFLDLVNTFVLDSIQNEEAHYNVGEPISEILASPIEMTNGKTSKLYPRQQVIGQGFLRATQDGKKSHFFNGGTGIGKTYITAKLSYAILREHFKRDNGRIIVYAQGHLIPKWKRQIGECLNPIGVFPKFYEIDSYKDVAKIPMKPDGLEVFLMPKDRVKRNYQIRFAKNYRYNILLKHSIGKFMEGIEDKEGPIVKNVGKLPLISLKLTALRIEKEKKRPVVLLKEQYDANGEIKGYKVATTSKMLKQAFSASSALPYHFEISREEYKDFLEELYKIQEALENETKLKSYRLTFADNGYTCPTCGGFVYDSPDDLFDEENYLEHLRQEPSNKSRRNNKCQHYIKADGTPLMAFEIEGIRDEKIGKIYSKTRVECPFVDADGVALSEEDARLAKANQYLGKYSIIITTCGAKLWTAYEATGYRVVNTADMLLRRFGKKHFDLAICDEVHLYAKESEQGITFGTICRLSDVVMGLTGTLTGGKSSDLYYTFWRMIPGRMVQLGYKYEEVSRFVDHYGRKKRVTKEYKADERFNKSGKGKKASSGWNEIAGISPLLYTNFLSGNMVSRKIEDMGIPMPKLRYFKHEVEMDETLSAAYRDLKNDILRFMKENPELSLGGSYINSLLAYPDYPNQPPINFKGCDLLVAVPKVLEVNNMLYPKEIKLLETIEREIKEGRKVLVYSVFSGIKGISDRLMEIISNAGYRVVELTSKVKLEKREEWIEQRHQEGYQVMVTNPECVSTGLDIVQYPTIYFYELSYNARTVRQAEKRHWRPGQEFECRICYSYYKETLQEDCIKLVGGKKKASLALEGVFSEDMLSAMGDAGDNGASVLAKVLQGRIKLKEDELDVFGFEAEDALSEVAVIGEDAAVAEVVPEKKGKVAAQLTLFTVTEEELKRIKNGKKKTNVAVGQLSFFEMVS